MNKSILKPCPFCGNDETVYMVREKVGDKSQWQVVCDYNWGGCGSASGYYDTPVETAKAWNRRDGEVAE